MRRHGADVRAFGVEPDGSPRYGPERVAVAGGDGTIGPAAELAGRLGVPLAVIPTGTANDFARASELPRRPRGGGALAATGSEHAADGARAPRRRAAVRQRRQRRARLGRRPARRAVQVPARPARLRGRRRSRGRDPGSRCACTVRADGERGLRRRRVAGDRRRQRRVRRRRGIGAADPDDGELDVAILPAGSRLGLARRAWGLRRGTIAEQRDVHGRSSSRFMNT